MKRENQSASPPSTWTCVVEVDQVCRENRSGVLYQVTKVSRSGSDASVKLRVLGVYEDAGIELKASALCGGSAWSRLAEDDDQLPTACFDKTEAFFAAGLEAGRRGAS